MLSRVLALTALAMIPATSAVAASCPSSEALPGVSVSARSASRPAGIRAMRDCRDEIAPSAADRPVQGHAPGFMRFGNTEVRIGGQVRAEGAFGR